nr:MAG TPA: hypothetical protein [Inoviridae sp.]
MNKSAVDFQHVFKRRKNSPHFFRIVACNLLHEIMNVRKS